MLFLFNKEYAQKTLKNSPFQQNMKEIELFLKSESQTQAIQQVTVLTIIKFAF